VPEGGELRPLSRAIDEAEYDLAVVVTGHMIDRPDRVVPRFPAGAEASVTASVDKLFTEWGVDAATLVVSGGARGADIIAAESAMARGADVWLLLALPERAFVEESVQLEGTDWVDRFRALRDRCPTYFQADELGPAPTRDAFARNNEWCLETARRVAGIGAVRVVAVWDGARGDGPGGTGDLVDRAHHEGAVVAVIPPLG
jgi:hypothetical protein